MPIYVYRCQECSELHEALVREGKSEPHDCPACGQASLKRIVAAIARPVSSTGDGASDMPSGMCGMGGCGSGACGHAH